MSPEESSVSKSPQKELEYDCQESLTIPNATTTSNQLQPTNTEASLMTDMQASGTKIEAEPVTDTIADAPATDIPIESEPVIDTPIEDETVLDTTVEDEPATVTPNEDGPATVTPTEEESATDTIIEDALATDMIIEDAPATETPIEDEPPTDTSIEEESAADTPIEADRVIDTPIEDETVMDPPIDEEPVEDQPATVTPNEDGPATVMPTEEESATDMIIEDAPATDMIIEDAPATETPIEDEPPTDTSIEEKSAADTPIEEESAADTPIEADRVIDTPIEDETVMDTPIDEEPVEDQPVTVTPNEDGPATVTSIEEESATDMKIEDEHATDMPIVEESATDITIENDPVTDTSIQGEPVIDTTISDEPATDSTITDMLLDGVNAMNQQKQKLWQNSGNVSAEDKAIFLLGNTGSGKTTATQIIAGDLNKLEAIEMGEELLIIDKDNRIGTSIQSKTQVPEYWIHPETQEGFWDCPGFDDNRGPEVDIAAMYTVKHALDTTTFAKFIVVVSHSSVKAGNDRLDFDLVATHVSRLIRNVTKLQPAIGLVVTKVGNFSGSNGKYLDDEKIITPIQKFLEKYVEIKQEDLKKCGDEEMKIELASKIQFVEGILANRENGSATNLYISRIPEDCGILAEMNSVQDSRRKLGEMINRLEYSSIIPGDFNMTLKAETRLRLEAQWIPENRNNISKSISTIVAHIRAEFGNRFYSNLGENPQESFKLLNQGVMALKNFLTTDRDKVPETKHISTHINRLYVQLGFSRNCTVASLELLEDQQKFFQIVTNRIDEPSVNFTDPFSLLLAHFLEIQEFYEFCRKTEADIVSYSSQVNLQKWIKEDNKKPWDSGVLQFIYKYDLTEVSPTMFTLWEKMDSADRNHLEKIVAEAEPKVDWQCSESKIRYNMMRITVTGRCLKFSDIVNTRKWPPKCNDKSVSEISIVALEKVFLDADLIGTGKEWHVSVISPHWQVVLGENEKLRKIELDGVKPGGLGKAAIGVGFAGNGKNGINGHPGGNAGSFFGVYETIQHPDWLLVSANGGGGGNGQAGGDGSSGRPGKDASFNDFPGAYRGGCGLTEGYYENGKFVRYRLNVPFYNKKWYTKQGGRGGRGGNGGNGGNSGLLGNPGRVEVIALNPSKSTIRWCNKRGNLGDAGFAGAGGIGGKNGDHFSCRHNHGGLVAAWWDGKKRHHINTKAASGTCGKPGNSINSMAVIGPTPAPWRSILDHTTFFFEKSSKGNSSISFSFNNSVIKHLNTLYFAKEVNFVEEKYYQLWNASQNPEIFESYYESLLERINKFIITQARNQGTAEKNYVLSLLYAVVKGKLIGMRRAENILKIVDTEGYFTALVDQLETLKTKEKEKLITEETSRFKTNLDKKVQEAQNLIEFTVQPAITETQKHLDGMNDDLLEELNDYLKAAEEDLEKRKDVKRKFQSMMWIRPLMSVLNTAGSLCSFLGPKGMAVAAVTNIATSTITSLLPSANPSQTQSSPVLPAAFKVTQASQDYYKQKIKNIRAQVDLAQTARHRVDDNSLQDVALSAENALEKLSTFEQALNSESGTVNPVNMIRLEHELDKSTTKLKETATFVAVSHGPAQTTEKKLTVNQQIVKNLPHVIKAADSIQGIARSIPEATIELGKFTQLVKEAEQTVKAVEVAKERFYDELIPALDTISQGIGWETDGLPGESKVALSVKKWKVKGLLKMMRGYIHQFTNGFQVAEKFQLSLDSLDEALTLLMEMYDHIEQYEEKKQFADFIGNVNSLSGSKAKIQDAELRSEIQRLEFFVDANLFYGEYQRAMHAFKQWVFPFASRYLSSEKDSPWKNMGTNLNQVAQFYGAEIQALNTELKKYKASTVIGDESLMVTNFISGVASSKPFYVWSNADWQGSIKKLLSGQAVHLMADVDMTKQDMTTKDFFEGKSAIKFKTIEVKLKSQNEIDQPHLNEKLDHFHMKLTHSGISVYKVMGNQYVMFDKSQTYRYSFERTKDGHVSSNVVSSKVDGKNADYLMSPYTWWTLQLIDATPQSGFGFNDLAKFGDQVDVELVGEGIYLDEIHADYSTLENLKLSKYYEPFNGETESMTRKNWPA